MQVNKAQAGPAVRSVTVRTGPQGQAGRTGKSISRSVLDQDGLWPGVVTTELETILQLGQRLGVSARLAAVLLGDGCQWRSQLRLVR